MGQSLQNFLEEEMIKIKLFQEYWLENHAENPEQFPLELPDDNIGIWFEMYTEFDADAFLKAKSRN